MTDLNQLRWRCGRWSYGPWYVRFVDWLLRRRSVYVCDLRAGHWTFVVRPSREATGAGTKVDFPKPLTRRQERLKQLRFFKEAGGIVRPAPVPYMTRSVEFGHWYVFDRHEARL